MSGAFVNRSYASLRLCGRLLFSKCILLTVAACGGSQSSESTGVPSVIARPINDIDTATQIENDGLSKRLVEDEGSSFTYGGKLLVSENLLADAGSLAVGSRYLAPSEDEAHAESLRALGFSHQGEQMWRRDANMLATETLVPSLMPELPEIDAVAVISTFRPQVREQYIYETLTQLFRALPAEAQVNVLVGNSDTDYVAPAVLSEKLGDAHAARIHVIFTPTDVDQYFKAHRSKVSVKATWNYARALRSYRGDKHLLLFEDDIVLADHALMAIRPLLLQKRTGIFSLYNDRCSSVEAWWQPEGSKLSVGTQVMRENGGDFPSTQAIVYAASLANDLGDYLTLRAGREPYDYMTGRYLVQFNYEIGYVDPSVVQHVGYATTGLSAGHPPRTSCFLPDL